MSDEPAFCPKCGKPHGVGAQFCRYCGTPFAPGESDSRELSIADVDSDEFLEKIAPYVTQDEKSRYVRSKITLDVSTITEGGAISLNTSGNAPGPTIYASESTSKWTAYRDTMPIYEHEFYKLVGHSELTEDYESALKIMSDNKRKLFRFGYAFIAAFVLTMPLYSAVSRDYRDFVVGALFIFSMMAMVSFGLGTLFLGVPKKNLVPIVVASELAQSYNDRLAMEMVKVAKYRYDLAMRKR